MTKKIWVWKGFEVDKYRREIFIALLVALILLAVDMFRLLIIWILQNGTLRGLPVPFASLLTTIAILFLLWKFAPQD